MSMSVGLLCDELFLLHECYRKRGERSMDAIKEYASAHNVSPKDTGFEIYFIAETSTPPSHDQASIKYTDIASFEHLLFKCFNFINFKQSTITYECNQEAT